MRAMIRITRIGRSDMGLINQSSLTFSGIAALGVCLPSLPRNDYWAVRIQTMSAQKRETVAIIGQGYVGLTIASFAANHHEVIGFDNREEVVANLNQGK